MLLILIIVLLGFVAGTIGSLVGFGGGVFIVPGLLLLGTTFAGLEYITPQIAVGTSLVVIIFTATAATLSYTVQKKVDFKAGLYFFLASGPGSVIGAYLNQFLNVKMFHFVFGIFLLFILYYLSKNKKLRAVHMKWHITNTIQHSDGTSQEYGYHLWVAFLICFTVGLIQGLLGIGGGSLLVPAMILLFWYPPHIAVATSMFVILLSSLMGSASHIYLNHVDWSLLLWLAPSAYFGGKLGANLALRLSEQKVTIVLRVLLLLLATHALIKGIMS